MADKKDDKSPGEILQEKLFLKKDSAWKDKTETDVKKIYAFADEYKDFLDNAKTEREAVKIMLDLAKEKGFKPIDGMTKAGDKVYSISQNKAIIFGIIGKDREKVRIIASHIDSPRLDLKPIPLYEDSGMAFFKTHYYGGIKKYHWVNIPLAIHGIIVKEDGTKVEIKIGEDKDDPLFIINDLLPHLARQQMDKPGREVVEAESLNILIGSKEYDDEKVKEKVKLNILNILHEKHGINEGDLISSDIEVVPAMDARDMGFDRSMIAAYGQDDRSAAYASFKAMLELDQPRQTCIGVFFDKEEIGSDGKSGAQSNFLENFMMKVTSIECNQMHDVFRGAVALSADVSDAMDVSYKDVHEPMNAGYLGRGVSIKKYTGHGGKYGASEAPAEFVSYLKGLMNKNKIAWHSSLLGKTDLGGGGTVAKYIANLGIETIDIGPPVLGMHSPYEVTAKVDIFETYRVFREFFADTGFPEY